VPERLKDLLLAAFAGEDAGGLPRTAVPEGGLAVHVMHPRFHGQDRILPILIRVGPVVAEATVNRDVHPTYRVHDADQAVEVGADVIVRPDAQIIQ
jgi:hypothetical protein